MRKELVRNWTLKNKQFIKSIQIDSNIKTLNMKHLEDQSGLVAKYFLDNFGLEVIIDKRKPSNKKEELATEYFHKVMEVFSVFDRLCRYEKYFADFLPKEETGISEAEAIEYHLRNYVQDFFILRERVNNIVDELKKDIVYYNIENTEDVTKALNHLKKNIDENFKKINQGLRYKHVHVKSISDYDLVRGKFFAQILSGEISIPNDMNLDIEKIKAQHASVTETNKNKYINQAKHNTVGLIQAKQFFASRFGYIFAELNAHNSSIFDMNSYSKDSGE